MQPIFISDLFYARHYTKLESGNAETNIQSIPHDNCKPDQENGKVLDQGKTNEGVWEGMGQREILRDGEPRTPGLR